MRKTALLGCAALFVLAAVLRAAQATAETAAYEWLHALVGEWESEHEALIDPSQPPVKMKGTESTRKIGDTWVVSEIKTQTPAGEVTGLLTIGYDS
jgi:hypothetical protein